MKLAKDLGLLRSSSWETSLGRKSLHLAYRGSVTMVRFDGRSRSMFCTSFLTVLDKGPWVSFKEDRDEDLRTV